MGLHGLLRDSFSVLYVNDVRTSQETHVWASMSCYGIALSFYMLMMFVPHKNHKPPSSVTGTALLFYV
jgi:hypothetical protein